MAEARRLCDETHIQATSLLNIEITGLGATLGRLSIENFLMRALGAIVLAGWLTLLAGQPAFAEKRVALVIGNSAYQNVTRLANPSNDPEAMAATFKGAGFDVVELKRDLNASEMRRALRDFSDTVRDADVAIVYFAGHGIEIDGVNYIIPVDAVLARDIDAFDEAIPLDRILTVIEPARQLRLVILDACRDNPFNKSMKRQIGSRAIARGLAKVEPASPNTLIAFAGQGRFDRIRRRQHEQPVHRGTRQISGEAGSRSAQGLWLYPRRSVEGHQQQAGAVHLRLTGRG